MDGSEGLPDATLVSGGNYAAIHHLRVHGTIEQPTRALRDLDALATRGSRILVDARDSEGRVFFRMPLRAVQMRDADEPLPRLSLAVDVVLQVESAPTVPASARKVAAAMFGPRPRRRPESLLSSHEAAEIVGCVTDKSLRKAMQRAGVRPVVDEGALGPGGKAHLWKFSDVMRLARERRGEQRGAGEG